MLKRLAVLGHPVSHSRSPAMHTAGLAEMGLGGEWSYEAIDVLPEEFAERVGAMPREGFVGANVTVPHKGAALALATKASSEAREIGAANTLTFAGGEIHADNTDGAGLLAALPASPRAKRSLVLGAGGAARAAIWALGKEGAEVTVWNRTAARAVAVAGEFGAGVAEATEPGDFDLLVNATAVGLGGEDPFAELPLDPESFRAGQVVVDLVYGEGESALVSAARAAGAEVVDGLEVLARQGAASLRIWTGREPPLDVMLAAARD